MGENGSHLLCCYHLRVSWRWGGGGVKWYSPFVLLSVVTLGATLEWGGGGVVKTVLTFCAVITLWQVWKGGGWTGCENGVHLLCC